MRLTPSRSRTLVGTRMNSAKPPSYWYPIADGPAVDVPPDLCDLPGDLVAEDARQRDVVMSETEDLRVRSAGRARSDPDDEPARTGLRHRAVLDPEITRRVQAGNLHGLASPSGPSSESTSSGRSAERRRAACSGTVRTLARFASTPTCSSPTAAIPTQTITSPSSQATPSGNWRKASIVSRIHRRLSSVPCGMANPSPSE